MDNFKNNKKGSLISSGLFKKYGILVLSLALMGCGCGGSSKKEDKSSQAILSTSKSEETTQQVASSISKLEQTTKVESKQKVIVESLKETSIELSKEESQKESSDSTKKTIGGLNKLQTFFTTINSELTREQLEAWIAENPDIFVDLTNSNGHDTYILAFTWEDTLTRYRDTRGVRLIVNFPNGVDKIQKAAYGGNNVTDAYFFNSDYLHGEYKNNPAGFYILKDSTDWIQVTAEDALKYQFSNGKRQVNSLENENK